jgi:hypothetical protein
MADNIEDFLRRAAERRQQRGAKPAPPPPPPPRQVVPATPVRVPNAAQQPNAKRARPVQKTPPQLQSKIKSRQKLAQKVESADDSMRDHLQNVFTHQLGNIPGNQPKTGPVTRSPKPNDQKTEFQPAEEAAAPPLAQQVVEALRNPENLRIAFVASEIFKRRF